VPESCPVSPWLSRIAEHRKRRELPRRNVVN
jgi:hypothetical protein